jgi:SCF-associated factor 1
MLLYDHHHIDRMPDLLGLPYQLLVDEVLSDLDADSLLRLREVSRATKDLADDELLWRRKIMQDFNFPLLSSARETGWQRLYRGLKTPSLYTWGDYSHNRIGRRVDAESIPTPIWNIIIRSRGVPLPLQIEWRNAQRRFDGNEAWSDDDENDHTGVARLAKPSSAKWQGVPVQIHAGGWSFYALTDTGRILSWGTSSALLDFTVQSGQMLETPTVLDTHMRTAKMLTVGREHLAALMWNGELFEWTKTWDRPVRLNVPHLFGLGKDAKSVKVSQVEAGWDFTAVLADVADDGKEAGTSKSNYRQITFWKTAWTEVWRDKYLRPSVRSTDPGNWSAPEMDLDAILLPSLPGKAVQIAAGDNFILALTDDYIVYYLSVPGLEAPLARQLNSILNRPEDVDTDGNNVPDPDAARSEMTETNKRDIERLMNQITSFYNRLIRQKDMHWQKLDKFCDDLHSSGVDKDGVNLWDKKEYSHLVTAETKVTHISAHFKHFAAYAPEAGAGASEGKSKGIVITGTSENPIKPIVMPELQGIQVIKVSHGDWHSGALTQDGRVLTWGEKSNGALGSWDAVPHPENTTSALQPNAIVFQPFRRMGIMRFFGPDETNQASQQHQSGQTDFSVPDSSHMVDAEKKRYMLRALPNRVAKPLPVRFGFPTLGEQPDGSCIEADDQSETKYVFDIAFAGWHSGALTIDRSLLS